MEGIQRFSVIPNKIPMAISFLWKKSKTSYNMECQGTLNSHNKLEQNKAGGFILTGFKTHYKAKAIKIMFYQHKGRYIELLKQKRKSRNEPLHIRTNDF